MVTRLAILGVTGSIGRQALDVVGSHPDRLRVTAVASARNASELETIATQTGASAAVLQERDGDDALCDLATRATFSICSPTRHCHRAQCSLSTGRKRSPAPPASGATR